MSKVKPQQIIIIVLVIFALYAVIVNPVQSADSVKAVFQAISDAVHSIFQFFDALLR